MRVRLKHQRLQELLAHSALSQNHWALKIGISRGHWSDIVNGRHPYPSPKTRERMLEVLGVPLADLFSMDGGPTAWGDTDFRVALHDRYLIDRELGQGGMGSVYVARDIARNRTVALKVVAPEAVAGIGQDAFLREIGVVARLQHPHILPLFDSGAVAEHPFFVMPWIRGGSLRDRLKRETRLALPSVVNIASGIASALTYAHGEQVLHCDVKPENVLLHDDHAYLMDFGIARILHAEASEWRPRRGLDVSAGTPAYVSPEQANGDADIDGRADVYSMACVVYEMLAGRPPFEGTSTEATVAQRFVGAPPPLTDFAPELPREVNDVITRAMSLDRARRPPSALEFAAELGAAAAKSRPLSARVSLAATRAAGSLRRRMGRPPANRFGGTVFQLVHDTRLTLRSLRRDWRFALAFIIPLALGLGAGATFYSIIDHVLYRPPPGVAKPHEIVRIAIVTEQFPDPFAAGNLSTSWLDYNAITRRTTTLSSVGAFISFRPSLGRGEDARTIPVVLATASYFSVLGARPQVGRFYTAEEDVASSELVPCVAGDRFWRARLGSGRDALGRQLEVGGLRCTVIGVAPVGFNGTGYSPVDLWLPLRASAEASHGDYRLWNSDGSHWLRLLGRRKPGVTDADIALDMTRAYRSVTNRVRDPQLRNSMTAGSLFGSAVSASSVRIRTARWLVGGALALLLLVAANLVNLLVARNLGRIRETAIRLALGGSRARLVARQLLECVILSLLAGGGALLVVNWVGPLARTVLFPGSAWAAGPVTSRIVVIAMAVSFAISATIAVLTAFFTTRVDPAALLNAGGGGRTTGSRASHRARLGLVAVQAAVSMALLIASAGFVRSFRSAASTQLGFDMKELIYADVPNLDATIPDDAEQRMFFMELHERFRSMPGVAGVSLAYNTPWYNNRNETLREPGRDSLPRVPGFGDPAFDHVTPDYLTTMRVALRAGRWFSESDNAGSPRVMIVSASMARHYWGSERAALGRVLLIGDSATRHEVIGVVDDIRFTGYLDAKPTPSYYVPYAQSAVFATPTKLFIRAQGDANALIPTIRAMVQSARPRLPAADVHLMQNHLDPLLASWRLGATAYTVLGALAALIAVLGLFSVMAYLVAERRKEFAIRGALGAGRAQIAAPMVHQAVLVVGAGVFVGFAVSLRAAQWLQPQLFQVQLLDPAVVAGIAAVLLGTGVLGVAGPARRAALLDPMEALRGD